MAHLIELDEYRFDVHTGEVFKSGDNGSTSERIPPQPAQLLNLLIEHYPAVVSRETIQQAIWPGVKTDFDGNLHFCIRQIRAAFGDSASNPKYIETIPRRGYRLIVPPVVDSTTDDNGVEKSKRDEDEATTVDSNSTCADRRSAKSAKPGDKSPTAGQIIVETQGPDAGAKSTDWIVPGLAITALIATILLVIAFNWPSNDQSNQTLTNVRPVRVAIMPFHSNNPAFGNIGSGSLGTRLLESFANEFGDRIDAIGPTTTESYAADQLSKLVADIKPRFIINGRFVDSSSEVFMLVEIIRASDGAHVWVKRFTPESDENEICKLTRQAMLEWIE